MRLLHSVVMIGVITGMNLEIKYGLISFVIVSLACGIPCQKKVSIYDARSSPVDLDYKEDITPTSSLL